MCWLQAVRASVAIAAAVAAATAAFWYSVPKLVCNSPRLHGDQVWLCVLHRLRQLRVALATAATIAAAAAAAAAITTTAQVRLPI